MRRLVGGRVAHLRLGVWLRLALNLGRRRLRRGRGSAALGQSQRQRLGGANLAWREVGRSRVGGQRTRRCSWYFIAFNRGGQSGSGLKRGRFGGLLWTGWLGWSGFSRRCFLGRAGPGKGRVRHDWGHRRWTSFWGSGFLGRKWQGRWLRCWSGWRAGLAAGWPFGHGVGRRGERRLRRSG